MRRLALFNYETELCDALTSHLAHIRSRYIRVRHQVQVGAEIPDFVVSFADPGERPRISAIESAILSVLLSQDAMSSEDIALRLFTRSERVETSLARLRRLALVINTDGDSWTLGSYASGIFESARLIAIEAKLTRWQDALAQAVSYRRFANLSFVALPMDVVLRRSDDLADDCREHQVGLLGVAAKELLIRVPAPAHQTRSADWVWTVFRMGATEPQRKREMRSTSCADGSGSFAD